MTSIAFGPRVPTIVISPFARASKVDHTVYDFSSMLRFAEDAFDLKYLPEYDPQIPSIAGMFNFKQKPLAPLILKQRHCPTYSPNFAGHVKLISKKLAGDQYQLDLRLAAREIATHVL